MTELQRLAHERRKKVWSEEEITYLREHYPHEPNCDVADALGVSSQLVLKKASELGLSKAKDYSRRRFFNRWVKKYKDDRYKNYA